MSMFRNLLMASKKPRIPDEYQEVEWIKGINGGYINLGYKGGGTTDIEIKVSDIANSGVLFGTYNTSWTTGLGMYCNVGANFYYHYNSNEKIDIVPPQHFTMRFGKGKTYIDGVIVANVSQKSFTNYYNMYMFAGNWRNSRVEQPTSYKLYAYNEYDSNGNISAHYVPCYRKSDNKIGLYRLEYSPLVSSFLQSTGSFEKGRDV